MNRYDYDTEVRAAICDYLDENEIKITPDFDDEATEAIYERLWASDSVTGAASGSYTCNAWTAEENICHNLGLLRDALETFGGDYSDIFDSPEACDVTIRCYVLRDALEKVLRERREQWNEEREEMEK